MIVRVLLLLAGILVTTAAPPEIVLQRNARQGLKVRSNRLTVYCYGGEKSWSRVWSTLQFVVHSKAEEFKLSVNDNATVLEEEFGSWYNWWSPWSSEDTYEKSVMIPPYGKTCVGLCYKGSLPSVNATIVLKENVISLRFPILLSIGVSLLLASYRLSRSVSFYYTTGVTIGILASVLVLIYIVSKLVPGRPVAYSVMLGGWALVAWVMSEVKSQLLPMITSYPIFITMYILVVGVTSFLFCYWKGPISHPRTFQVIQWSIQLVAMMLVYHATQLREASLILMIVIMSIYLTRTRASSWIGKFYLHHVLLRWYVMFPPKHKLLTEKEYKEEGVRETALALKQLRDFCRQNTGEMYSIMGKLQSPNRFSKFLDGEFHLTDDEVQHYHRSASRDSDNDE